MWKMKSDSESTLDEILGMKLYFLVRIMNKSRWKVKMSIKGVADI